MLILMLNLLTAHTTAVNGNYVGPYLRANTTGLFNIYFYLFI